MPHENHIVCDVAFEISEFHAMKSIIGFDYEYIYNSNAKVFVFSSLLPPLPLSFCNSLLFYLIFPFFTGAPPDFILIIEPAIFINLNVKFPACINEMKIK